jgi:amino acid adenylation domain-containing protein/thioester reductase-like protein
MQRREMSTPDTDLAGRILRRRLASQGTAEERAAPESGLSPAQERMWFLHQMDPHSSAYTVTTGVRVRGDLDVEALRAALRLVMLRHAMLRAAFPQWRGQPCRSTVPTVAVPLDEIDLSDLWPEERDRSLREHMNTVARTPFDLAVVPLWRSVLIRLAADEHVLVMSYHHIVVDGWSLDVINRDLSTAYGAALRGVTSEDETWDGPVPLGPDDVVGWERNRLTGRSAERDLEHWRAVLADAPVLELPMARSQQTPGRRSSGHVEVRLEASLTAGLEALAARLGMSLYMVTAAAFAALLHRYSGQDDIVFGSPVANRDSPDVENVVGLFVNTVVMRADISGNPTGTELFTRFRNVAVDALRYQHVPFERVVQSLAPERVATHNPLFRVMFALQNFAATTVEFEGTECVGVPVPVAAARFDLECILWRRGHGIDVRILYNEDILDRSGAQRIAQHYGILLDSLVQDPAARVCDLPVLDEKEERELRLLESRPAVDGPPTTLHNLVLRHAIERPEAVALRVGAVELTFGELATRAGGITTALRARGVSRGDTVGLFLERGIDYVAALLGVCGAGAAFLPLDPADPADRRSFILNDAGVRLVVGSGPQPARADEEIGWLDLFSISAASPAVGGSVEEPDDVAYVIYTSGTTGRPKGVRVRHRNVVNTLRAYQQCAKFGPRDHGLVLARHTFDVFYYELISAMAAGGSSRIVTEQELYDDRTIVRYLGEATCFQAVPGLMGHLLTTLASAGVDACRGMRQVVTGGDQVPPAMLSRLHAMFPEATVAITYGPTEAAIFCTRYVSHKAVPTVGFPIGTPLPGTVVRVGDSSGRPLPIGMTGEIWIGGAGVAAGYVNRPAENTERFVQLDDAAFYRSGDRGRRRPDGQIEFVGRADQQVKIRGFRVELGEVEAVMAATPGVRHAVAVPVGDTVAGRQLAGYVVPDLAAVNALRHNGAAAKADRWQELFDRTYDARVKTLAGDHDFTGWNSSYAGTALPLEDMREWSAGCLEQIRSVIDVDAGLRVLDLGCGTGLMLLGLAEGAERYVGVDFSARVLADLRHLVDRRGLGSVELRTGSAAAPPIGEDETFDLVILNSVAQYFPDEAYLRRVLDRALAATAADGAVYVGDVRSLPLLSSFHHSVEAGRDPSADPAVTAARAERRSADEAELVIHPEWFSAYAATRNDSLRVATMPRRGRRANELTRYRYDVVLRRRIASPSPFRGRPWSPGLVERTLTVERPARLDIHGVPNAVLSDAEEAVLLDDLRDRVATMGYSLIASVRRGDSTGVDVRLSRPAADNGGTAGLPDPTAVAWPAATEQPDALINDPLWNSIARRMSADVRDQVRARLPEYMMPSSITVLPQFPLTTNDKVDRAALPRPRPASLGCGRQPETAGERLVAEVWAEVLGHTALAAEDDFFAVGGTSLLAIEAAVALRARNVVVSPKDIFERRTVDNLGTFIDNAARPNRAGSRRPAAGKRAHELTEPRLLPDGDGEWQRAESVLVTGATGMLGIHLLHELLDRKVPEIVCVVRAADDESAMARLVNQYRWYFPGENIGDRVLAVAADLTQDMLGLSASRWRSLAERCDNVLHAAADVRHAADRAEVFRVNVDGTRAIIDLATRVRPSRLLYVSTIGVKGVTPVGASPSALTEADLDVGQEPTEAYSASKTEAERLVWDSVPADQRVIFRVGTVAPHSVTGRFQRNIDAHFLSRYLRSTMELGVAGVWPGRGFALIPVDIMAHNMLALADRRELNGETLHIQTPHHLSHEQVVGILREIGYRIDLVSADELVAVLAERGRDPRSMGAVGRLLPQLDRAAGTPVRLDAAWTWSWQELLGLSCEPPTPEWFAKVVRHGVDVGYYPPATARPKVV